MILVLLCTALTGGGGGGGITSQLMTDYIADKIYIVLGAFLLKRITDNMELESQHGSYAR